MIQAFKVVRRGPGGQLVSCYAKPPSIYTPGEWTEAPFGGLLVFDCLAAADNFAFAISPNMSASVWRAECEGPIKLPPFSCDPHRDVARRLWDLWTSGRAWKLNGLVPHPWPLGTLAFARVRLLER